DGTLTALSSNIKNTFTGQTTQTVVLGSNKYTATIGPYSPPGPTGSSNAGSIAAHATVTVESVILQDVPEPSTLVLAFLAAPAARTAAASAGTAGRALAPIAARPRIAASRSSASSWPRAWISAGSAERGAPPGCPGLRGGPCPAGSSASSTAAAARRTSRSG